MTSTPATVSVTLFLVSLVFMAGVFFGVTRYALSKLGELINATKQEVTAAIEKQGEKIEKQAEEMKEMLVAINRHDVEIDHLKQPKPGFKTGNSR